MGVMLHPISWEDHTHAFCEGASHTCASFVQDANGDSDLWDLAVIEGGEAVRRPTSTSPFASKALLTCFNSDVSIPTPAAHDTHALLCATPLHALHRYYIGIVWQGDTRPMDYSHASACSAVRAAA